MYFISLYTFSSGRYNIHAAINIHHFTIEIEMAGFWYLFNIKILFSQLFQFWILPLTWNKKDRNYVTSKIMITCGGIYINCNAVAWFKLCQIVSNLWSCPTFDHLTIIAFRLCRHILHCISFNTIIMVVMGISDRWLCRNETNAQTACNRCITFDLLKFAFVCFRCPTTFWVTNPMTYMANNVAAGSDVSYALFELVSK